MRRDVTHSVSRPGDDLRTGSSAEATVYVRRWSPETGVPRGARRGEKGHPGARPGARWCVAPGPRVAAVHADRGRRGALG
ncbi:hypothetical protein GCM10027072_17170 [Streptomyces bullii]